MEVELVRIRAELQAAEKRQPGQGAEMQAKQVQLQKERA